MIHYHGGPITPETAARRAWHGRHAFISYAHPKQIGLVAETAQSFALDNGAFSFWKARKPVDWRGYYDFVRDWRRHPGFDFAVVPDVIDGSEDENDLLAEAWPLPRHEGLSFGISMRALTAWCDWQTPGLRCALVQAVSSTCHRQRSFCLGHERPSRQSAMMTVIRSASCTACGC